MLTADLTIVDNHGSITLGGSRGSKVYALVSSDATGVKRREAATAVSTPFVLTTKSSTSGSGYNQRQRTLVRHDYSDLTTNLDLTGGVIPSSAVQLTIDLPVRSNGAITAAKVKDQVYALLDVLVTSGQLDKILNQEL